jgi:hypothetical protein
MASKKKKNKSKTKSGSSVARKMAGGAGRGAAWLGRLLGVPVMAVLIYVAGSWCLWQYAARGAVRPSNPQTDAAGCPWLQPRDVVEINSAVSFGRRASMYDRGICSKVAARYDGNPWIERVVAVRRRFPNTIVVDLAVRRPFASVRSAGRFHVVDANACRLPVRSAGAGAAEVQYPVIEGIRVQAPVTGGNWQGRPIKDALRLAILLQEVLKGRGAGMRLASVEVVEEKGSLDDLPQMVARTASGALIDWGSYSHNSSVLIPSVQEKRKELERVLAEDVADPATLKSVIVRYKGRSTPTFTDGLSAVGGN